MVSCRRAANWLSVILEVSRPAISTLPLVGRSSPPMMFSSVVLPEPEGPIRQTNSPGCTTRLTLTSARTISSPSLCSFQASVILTTGPPAGATLSGAGSVTVIGFLLSQVAFWGKGTLGSGRGQLALRDLIGGRLTARQIGTTLVTAAATTE